MNISEYYKTHFFDLDESENHTIFCYRQKAYEQFVLHGIPHSKMDFWRYVDLTDVFQPSPQKSPFKLKIDDDDIPSPATSFSDPPFYMEFLPPLIDAIPDPFYVLNAFTFQQDYFLKIPDQTSVSKPIKVSLEQASDFPFEPKKTYYQPSKIMLVIGKNSKVTLDFHLLTQYPAPHFINTVFDIILEPYAELEVVAVSSSDPDFGFNIGSNQNYSMSPKSEVRSPKSEVWSPKSIGFMESCPTLDLDHSIATVFHIQQKEHSQLRMTEFQSSQAFQRTLTYVDLVGSHSNCVIQSLSLARQNAQNHHHVIMNHVAPECQSKQLFKTILKDQAKTEFNGLVKVHPQAHSSVSEQVNHNLLLSSKAQAYTRPRLRIENNDVSCTHGATVGQLDEEALFYFLSRGFSRKLAIDMLITGFAQEILSLLP